MRGKETEGPPGGLLSLLPAPRPCSSSESCTGLSRVIVAIPGAVPARTAPRRVCQCETRQLSFEISVLGGSTIPTHVLPALPLCPPRLSFSPLLPIIILSVYPPTAPFINLFNTDSFFSLFFFEISTVPHAHS